MVLVFAVLTQGFREESTLCQCNLGNRRQCSEDCGRVAISLGYHGILHLQCRIVLRGFVDLIEMVVSDCD